MRLPAREEIPYSLRAGAPQPTTPSPFHRDTSYRFRPAPENAVQNPPLFRRHWWQSWRCAGCGDLPHRRDPREGGHRGAVLCPTITPPRVAPPRR